MNDDAKPNTDGGKHDTDDAKPDADDAKLDPVIEAEVKRFAEALTKSVAATIELFGSFMPEITAAQRRLGDKFGEAVELAISQVGRETVMDYLRLRASGRPTTAHIANAGDRALFLIANAQLKTPNAAN